MTQRTRKPPKEPQVGLPKSTEHKMRSVQKVLDGFSAVEVGRLFGDSARAVAYWVTRFKAHGPRGLETAPRAGRPQKLTPAQWQKVKTYLHRANSGSLRITGDSLSKFIQQRFRIKMTRQHCRRLITKFSIPQPPL